MKILLMGGTGWGGHHVALALEHPQTIGQIYNICLDHAVTLNRHVALNAQALGKTAHVVCRPMEEIIRATPELVHGANGLRFLATHMCFNIAKARRDLECHPRVTPEEAIEETAIGAAREAHA